MEELVEGGLGGLRSGRFRQTYVSLIASFVTLNVGLALGWISPMSLILTGEDSPVGVLTEKDISILAALPYLATMIFIPVICFVINNYGRKIGFQLVALLSAISATILTYSSSTTALYSGQLMSGFIYVGGIVSYTYVAEITDDSIRGTLASFCVLQVAVGTFLSSVVGNELTYKNYNSTMILLPVIYFSLSLFLPESPFFLFDQSRKEDAIKSLLWLRGNNKNLVEKEIQLMESAHAIIMPETSINSIYRSPGLRRAALIALFLTSSQVFSGNFIIFYYDEIIYQKVGSPISVEYSSMVTAFLPLVSGIFGVIMVDIFGRKPLLYASYSLGFISMTILSIYLFVKTGYEEGNWVPFACINVSVFGYAFGFGLITPLITAEIIPSHMRPKISAIILILYTISMAMNVESFPFLEEYFGLYSVFIVPGVVNLGGVFMTWYVVPETRGKSHVSISNELNK